MLAGDGTVRVTDLHAQVSACSKRLVWPLVALPVPHARHMHANAARTAVAVRVLDQNVTEDAVFGLLPEVGRDGLGDGKRRIARDVDIHVHPRDLERSRRKSAGGEKEH